MVISEKVAKKCWYRALAALIQPTPDDIGWNANCHGVVTNLKRYRSEIMACVSEPAHESPEAIQDFQKDLETLLRKLGEQLLEGIPLPFEETRLATVEAAERALKEFLEAVEEAPPVVPPETPDRFEQDAVVIAANTQGRDRAFHRVVVQWRDPRALVWAFSQCDKLGDPFTRLYGRQDYFRALARAAIDCIESPSYATTTAEIIRAVALAAWVMVSCRADTLREHLDQGC